MAEEHQLIEAIKSRNKKSALILLQSGVNPNFVFNDDSRIFNLSVTPLRCAINSKASTRLIKLLLQYGAKPNYKDISAALKICDLSTIKLLIDNDACPNCYPMYSESALHAIASSNNPDGGNIAEFLIQRGGRVDHENECYNTPLQFAVHANNREVIETLLQYGAQPCYSHKKESPLQQSFGLSSTIVKNMIKYAALQINPYDYLHSDEFFKNFTVKMSRRRYLNFAQQCMAEINTLKELTIRGNELTLFDFVVSYGASIVYCRDSNVISNIFKCLTTATLTIYAEVILKAIDRKILLNKLLEVTTQKKFSYRGNCTALDYHSVEDITKYLTKKDILNLFAAISYI